MHELIIVGAGLAGLTLAWRLQSRGFEARVVEARPRVGGRTEAMLVGEERFDLGATWIWESETAVLELIDELGLETFPGHRGGDDLYEAVDGPPARIQLPASPVAELRVAGGTAAIADSLARLVNVERSRPVQRITADDDAVVVELADEILRARRVVIALPPALLGTTIAFKGAPDDQADALRHVPVWMGEMAKIVAVYDSPFWLEDGLSGRVFSHRGPMVEMHDISGRDRTSFPGLFGFVPRSRAVGAWQDAARDQLVRLFGARAGSPRAFEVRTWWTDRETMPPKHEAAQQLFGHPFLRRPFLDGRVHLASTETAGVSTGHLDGAVRRANRLAELLVRQER